MEEGYSLDEIADYLSGKQAPKEKEKETEEEKGITGGDIAKMVIGTALDIGISEGGKMASTALGGTIGTVAGVPTGPGAVATGGAGGAIGYGIGAPFFGAVGSAVNQYINTGEVNPAVTTVDAATNLIPLGKVSKAGDVVAQVSKFLGKAPIKSAVATGTFSGLANVGARDISTNEDITLKDYAIGGGLGAGGTLVFMGATTATGKLYNKFKNRTPAQLRALADAGDADAIELVDTLTAGLSPENLRMTPTNFTGSVVDYINNATRATSSKVTPSRVIGYDATTAAKKAKSSVEAVEGTATNLGKQIDFYLKANPQYRDDAIAFLNGEDRPNLPPELLDNLVFGRAKIRAEQQRMIDLHNSGDKLLPNNRAETIEDSLNRGDYLTRAYEFFQNPNYKPSKEKYEALRKSLTTGVGDKDKMTDAQANEYLAELQLKMKGNPTEFSAFMQGKGTPNVLKQRKVVSKELEDFLGLIEEPGRRVETTMSVLNRINEYSEADARIAKALIDSGAAVRSSDPRANTQGLQPLNLKRGEFLVDGEKLLVDPYTQTAINKIYASRMDQDSNFLAKRLIQDFYETAVSGFKSAKVLGNLSSYLIQAPSNLAATLGAGMNPILGLGNATKMALGTLSGTRLGGLPVIKKFANQASPLTLQAFEDFKKRGMITGNFAYEDLKAGLQGKRLGKALEKVTDVPGRVYSLPDNIFRIVNYENNMHVLKKMMPTATDEQIKEMGSRLTTRTYPNYDSISPEIKVLSRAGIMPQFVAYTLEFARTQFEQAKAIRGMMDGTFVSKLGAEFKDIPVNQAAMKKEAAKRAVAMASAYAAATYGLNEFNRKTFTKEEERAYRDTVAAEYERDKPLMLYRKEDGSVGSINTSVYLPQTILANPIMAVLRGEDAEEGTKNFANILGKELIGEGAFAFQGLSSLVSGRDFDTGELISNDPSTVGNIADRTVNFAKEFIPSTITAIQKPGKTPEEKLTRQLGIREEKRTIPEGFGFKARLIHEAVGNIKSTMSGHQYALKDGRVTPEQYKSLIANEQSNYAGNMQKMLDHVQNLRTLGETDETIIPMLKDAKFSSLDTLNLLEGKVPPFEPTNQKTTSEMLDELIGKNNSETQQNIRNFIKKDPIVGDKILNAYRDRMRTQGIVLSPKESLLAGLPTDEKVKRLFPEIQSSRDPQAEIRRLFKKKILTETDVKAIVLRQRSLRNE